MIATIFLDQLCFAELILRQNSIETSYDAVICSNYVNVLSTKEEETHCS